MADGVRAVAAAMRLARERRGLNIMVVVGVGWKECVVRMRRVSRLRRRMEAVFIDHTLLVFFDDIC